MFRRAANGPGSTWGTPTIAGAVFLVGMAGLMLFVRSRPEPSVRLTPLEGITSYHVHVSVDGQVLSETDLQRRYAIPSRGRVSLPAATLRAVIRNVENAQRESGDATVRLHSRENGTSPEVWLWPEG